MFDLLISPFTEFAFMRRALAGCLALALEAGRTGGTLPCVMNAANEVAVAAFLADACRLTDIDATVERVMEQMGSEPVESLEQLEDIDARSRALASDILTRG